MQSVKIKANSNGYVLQLDNDPNREYVFKATEIAEMLEFVGKQIHGRRVKVELQ